MNWSPRPMWKPTALSAAPISAAFPQHQILSEELAPQQTTSAADLWIVDPIDGTVNYAHQHPNVGFPFLITARPGPAAVVNPFLRKFLRSRGR